MMWQLNQLLVFRPRDLVLLRALNCPYNIGLDKADWRIFNLNIADKSQHFSDIYRIALEKMWIFGIDTTLRDSCSDCICG